MINQEIKRLEKAHSLMLTKLKELDFEKDQVVINEKYTRALLEYNKQLVKSPEKDVCVLTAEETFIQPSRGMPQIHLIEYKYGIVDKEIPVELKEIHGNKDEPVIDMVFVNVTRAGYAKKTSHKSINFNMGAQGALKGMGINVHDMEFGKISTGGAYQETSIYKFTDLRVVYKTITGDGRGKIKDIEEKLEMYPSLDI